MKRAWLRSLGSPRMALYGMVPLAIGSILSYGNPESTPVWVLVVPLFFLSLILLIAILTNPRIYRPKALLLFHVSLLLLVVLVAYGRLAHFEAHVEMVAGKPFSTDELLRVKSGILHDGQIENIEFIQGSYTVQYSPGMVRGITRSQVSVRSEESDTGWQQQVVGDDIPLIIDGYRFYTSFNKT